ncbi:hypothetical protein EIN_167600 [Entamoeba invadens IP1]|uniref:Uncharacterized protein n=1 Tax=Entamoeba invadens IP1 TaxID=370355 RepID=A0A0A1TY31_ENTIV|nr:hypothetical protein EIN_167600 [Entamoeba invadens IP1]ELP84445.1 hypothetical protein EIN_167600 [Entamoeba invadens IP1]|eukprot:XP_004183791.1 hypothetical protein EIN_167600 [Entamoeba invadens IP1]
MTCNTILFVSVLTFYFISVNFYCSIRQSTNFNNQTLLPFIHPTKMYYYYLIEWYYLISFNQTQILKNTTTLVNKEFAKGIILQNNNIHCDSLDFTINKTPKIKISNTSLYSISPVCNNQIDAVWLWVNGSEPKWRDKFKRYKFRYEPNRFRDFNSIKYSMRSVFTYLPYIKNYFIITDNQIPDFIDAPIGQNSFQIIRHKENHNNKFYTQMDVLEEKLFKKNNEKNHNFNSKYETYTLEIVSHNQLFDAKELPNFNSDAIETVIYRIPRLSECFVYLNDDFIFTNYTPPEYFIKENRLQIYTENNLAPDEKWISENKWHKSIASANQKLNFYFNLSENTKRPYISHSAYFFRKSLLVKLEESFKETFNHQRSNRIRSCDAVNYPFFAEHYSYLLGVANYVHVDGWTFFWNLREDHTKNVEMKNRILKMKPYCICVNDDFEGSIGVSREINYLLDWYRLLFPDPMIFERGV